MAVGDGVIWNETLPSNSTVANEIDDYDRDLRIGVRSRMAREHIWPSSQTATNEGGHHAYVTFQAQTAAPTMAGTTAGAIWVKSSDLGIYITNSTANDVLIISGASLKVITTGTQGSIPICSSANPNTIIRLTGSADGSLLTCHSNTGAPTWEAPVVKAWITFSGDGTALNNIGCSGASKIATGVYRVTWSTPFADTNYCILISGLRTSGNAAFVGVSKIAVATAEFIAMNAAHAATDDYDQFFVSAMGTT